MKIIYLRGMQASGKSFYAKEFVKTNKDYRIVNRDAFRHMLDNYSFSKETEKLVTELEYQAIITLLKNNYNVIVDKMNLNNTTLNEDIRKIKEALSSVIIDIEIKEFPITLGEAIERDKNREFSIGENVLKNTWRKYEIELRRMVEDSKPKIKYNVYLPDCAIIDLDGTLAKNVSRQQFDETKVIEDQVIYPVKFILNNIKNDREVTKILLSGRKDSCKEQTIRWLDKNNIPFDKLLMRKADDNRPDNIIKKEIYENEIKDKYNVLFVIDDRPKVLDMWQSLGLFTFNVNQDVYCKNKF